MSQQAAQQPPTTGVSAAPRLPPVPLQLEAGQVPASAAGRARLRRELFDSRVNTLYSKAGPIRRVADLQRLLSSINVPLSDADAAHMLSLTRSGPVDASSGALMKPLSHEDFVDMCRILVVAEGCEDSPRAAEHRELMNAFVALGGSAEAPSAGASLDTVKHLLDDMGLAVPTKLAPVRGLRSESCLPWTDFVALLSSRGPVAPSHSGEGAPASVELSRNAPEVSTAVGLRAALVLPPDHILEPSHIATSVAADSEPGTPMFHPGTQGESAVDDVRDRLRSIRRTLEQLTLLTQERTWPTTSPPRAPVPAFVREREREVRGHATSEKETKAFAADSVSGRRSSMPLLERLASPGPRAIRNSDAAGAISSYEPPPPEASTRSKQRKPLHRPRRRRQATQQQMDLWSSSLLNAEVQRVYMTAEQLGFLRLTPQQASRDRQRWIKRNNTAKTMAK